MGRFPENNNNDNNKANVVRSGYCWTETVGVDD